MREMPRLASLILICVPLGLSCLSPLFLRALHMHGQRHAETEMSMFFAAIIGWVVAVLIHIAIPPSR